jgi:hypothetical protein
LGALGPDETTINQLNISAVFTVKPSGIDGLPRIAAKVI